LRMQKLSVRRRILRKSIQILSKINAYSPVLKTDVPQGTGGSNPPLSALIQRLSTSLKKTQSVALATGCVLSFLVSRKAPTTQPLAITLSRNQPSGPKSGTKTSQQNWPRHGRHSMRFDKRFRAAKSCRDISAPRSGADIDAVKWFDSAK